MGIIASCSGIDYLKNYIFTLAFHSSLVGRFAPCFLVSVLAMWCQRYLGLSDKKINAMHFICCVRHVTSCFTARHKIPNYSSNECRTRRLALRQM